MCFAARDFRVVYVLEVVGTLFPPCVVVCDELQHLNIVRVVSLVY